jgi:hypothetical protein
MSRAEIVPAPLVPAEVDLRDFAFMPLALVAANFAHEQAYRVAA